VTCLTCLTRQTAPTRLIPQELQINVVTHLIEFGYPERFVQDQVGHAFASTTAIYTSVSNDFKNQALKAALRRVYAPQEES
jgi:integrase/recombinase XerC